MGETNQATKNPEERYPQGCPRRGEDEHPNRSELIAITQANGQQNMNAVCICGKVCKNHKGLKIHQAKMACLRRNQVEQRSGMVNGATVLVAPTAEPGEMEEEQGPESPHSTRNLQATQVPPLGRKSEQQRVMWPAANNKEWVKLDEDVDECLEVISKGNVDQKLQTMRTIIMNMGAERKRHHKEEAYLAEPTLKEVEVAVRAARSSSVPGPSGVPYKVSKQCPWLLRRLWKLLRVIWQRGKVAAQWRYAEGVWILKEEDSRNIEQFRIISLLSVESKIFFKIVSQRLTDFLLKNTYLDTLVQKGGVPGVPG
ncbi:hypothetical protein QQF64_009564 [Cirrhinus molitorella]|uniref:Uncharacterized protein n=1 Tax=Cirrhinus molitorella TaxID=172907 RepID=A0ABR3M541_9TELE